MKKRFLKFCSVLLCVINLFSVSPIKAAIYEVKLKDKEFVFLIPGKVTRDSPKIKFKKNIIGDEKLELINGKKFELNLNEDLKESIKNEMKENNEIVTLDVVNKIVDEVIFVINGCKSACDRQKERKEGKRKYRFVSQLLANSIPMFKLPTPFGEAELTFAHGDGGNCYDIKVCGGHGKDSYEKICQNIEKVVEREKLPELARIIDKYLRLSYASNYKCLGFKEILKQMKNDVKENDFFDKPKNLNSGCELKKKYDSLKECEQLRDKAKEVLAGSKTSRTKTKEEKLKAAETKVTKAQKNLDEYKDKIKSLVATFCATLFISEAGPNRAFDGGKSARASLVSIINGEKIFSEVFLGNTPVFYPALEGGAGLARNRQNIDKLKKDKDKNKVLKLKPQIISLESEFSEDSGDEVEDSGGEDVSTQREELKKEFDSWIKDADGDKILKFKKLFEQLKQEDKELK